jgi:hypothetical protein
MVTHFRNWQVGVAGVLIGAVLAGWCVQGVSQARAEVRKATSSEPEQHFKSGGRLSETVLQEILIVLKRMDDRLARMEAASQGRGGMLQGVPSSDSGPATITNREPPPEIKVRRAK